ncbi:MAG: fold metallo-hydrolase [Flaviaesturariibacter sp.]|nr:fold metallo-hydrolase [Flaviaesturariibacter sp.]
MITVQAFTFNPVQENTYVLYNEKGECCIIDPGPYFPAEEQALTDFIEENKLTPVLLLNTHCHFDHIFGNKLVQQTYGLTLYLHPLEKQVLDLGPASTQKWGIPWDKWYEGEYNFIEEGNVIQFGDEELQVLLTPGHSPGSVCFYSKSNKFIIAGDVLFNGSVGRTDLPGGDFSILEKSIRTKLYTLPGDVVVLYPGHGESTTIGDEMKSNPFVKMS